MENLTNFINTSITEAEWVDKTATLTRTLTVKNSEGKNVEEYLVFYGDRKAFVERFKNMLGNIEVPEANQELVSKLNAVAPKEMKWKISTASEKKAYPMVHL